MERFTRLHHRPRVPHGVELSASNSGVIDSLRSLQGEQIEILIGILDCGKSMDLLAIEMGVDESVVANKYKEALSALGRVLSRQGISV